MRCNVTIKYILAGVLSVLLMISTVAAAELKLGYVNATLLLEQSPQAQEAASRMKKEFGERETALLTGKAEMDEMQKKLSRDGDIMSEAKRKQLRLDILSRQRELVRNEEVLRQDVAIRRSDVIGLLQVTIRTAIEAIGARGQYDIIFYDAIAYGNPALDITAQVLDELKKMGTSTGK